MLDCGGQVDHAGPVGVSAWLMMMGNPLPAWWRVEAEKMNLRGVVDIETLQEVNLPFLTEGASSVHVGGSCPDPGRDVRRLA